MKNQTMEVYFVTTKDNLKGLKEDFISLKKWLKFPCDFTEKFVSQNLHKETEVATTYYNRNDPNQSSPMVELSPTFFQHNTNDRRTILLHEIIHVCHHTNELSEYQHRLLVKKIGKFYSTMIGRVSKNGWDKKAKEIQVKLEVIRFAAILMFEMWDHLLFKENYPLLFPRIMKLSVRMSEDQFEKKKEEDFGKFYKYLLVSFLIRIAYLKKISGKQISKKLDFLKKQIESRLQNLAEYSERRVIRSTINALSDIKQYPRPKKIAYRYDKFLEQIWKEKLNQIR